MSLVALGAPALVVVHDVGYALRKHMATGSDTTMRFREEKSFLGPIRLCERMHGVTLAGALLGTLCMALIMPANALNAPWPSNGKPSLTRGCQCHPPAGGRADRELRRVTVRIIDARTDVRRIDGAT